MFTFKANKSTKALCMTTLNGEKYVSDGYAIVKARYAKLPTQLKNVPGDWEFKRGDLNIGKGFSADLLRKILTPSGVEISTTGLLFKLGNKLCEIFKSDIIASGKPAYIIVNCMYSEAMKAVSTKLIATKPDGQIFLYAGTELIGSVMPITTRDAQDLASKLINNATI